MPEGESMPFHRHVAAAALAVMAFLSIVAGAAQAQMPLGKEKTLFELRKQLETSYSNPEYVRDYVRRAVPMYDDVKQLKFARHLMTTMADPRMIDRVLALSTPADDAKLTNTQLQDYFVESGMKMAVSGLSRLEDADIEFFMHMVIPMHQQLPPDLCKANILGEVSGRKSAAMEHMWMAKLPPEAFDAVLALYRRSYEAELGDYPAPRVVNEKQGELVTQALKEKVRHRWASMPDPSMALRAYKDTKAADPAELCASTIEVLKAYLDITGPMRSWGLVTYVKAMAR